MIVRGDRLRKTMSAYFVDRIQRQPLIDVRLGTQVTALYERAGHLSAVSFMDGGKEETRLARGAVDDCAQCRRG